MKNIIIDQKFEFGEVNLLVSEKSTLPYLVTEMDQEISERGSKSCQEPNPTNLHYSWENSSI